MEHGFYHPEIGYWQTISSPDAETLAGYPEGTVQVPLKPVQEGFTHEWDTRAKRWVAEAEPHVEPGPAPPTTEQLLAAIEAIGRAAGVSDKALGTAITGAGIERKKPSLGGKEPP